MVGWRETFLVCFIIGVGIALSSLSVYSFPPRKMQQQDQGGRVELLPLPLLLGTHKDCVGRNSLQVAGCMWLSVRRG